MSIITPQKAILIIVLTAIVIVVVSFLKSRRNKSPGRSERLV
jgi:hypothetical protein